MKPRPKWLSRAGIAMVLATSIGLGWGIEARLVGFAWSVAILVVLSIPSPLIATSDQMTVDRLLVAIDRLDERAFTLNQAVGRSWNCSGDFSRIRLEIRAPLVGLLGTSELLLSTTLDEGQHNYAIAIAESGAAILGIVDSILHGLEPAESEPIPASFAHRIVREAPTPAFAPLDKRVLVVDDREVNRKVAVRLLEQIGCRVVAVENGEVGVRMASCEAFDLILMDLRMPMMDGITATRLIRKREARSDRNRVRILGFSADLTKDEHQAWTEAGMDGLMVKPATRSSLYAWLTDEITSKGEALVGGPVFDARGMLDRCDGDPLFAAEILASFVESTPRSIKSIREALASDDFPRLADEAHGLKGASLTIGARKLARATNVLEDSARSGDPGPTHDAVVEVEADWDELRNSLKAAIGGLTG